MSKSLELARKYLGQTVKVAVDRPLGSKHPKFNYYYPINYGYLAGVVAPDGEGLDAYILGTKQPVANFTGKCVAIIHREDDDDDKLVVVTDDLVDITDADIMREVEFQEKYFNSSVVRS